MTDYSALVVALTDHVRTPEGAQKFKTPIGGEIRARNIERNLGSVVSAASSPGHVYYPAGAGNSNLAVASFNYSNSTVHDLTQPPGQSQVASARTHADASTLAHLLHFHLAGKASPVSPAGPASLTDQMTRRGNVAKLKAWAAAPGDLHYPAGETGSLAAAIHRQGRWDVHDLTRKGDSMVATAPSQETATKIADLLHQHLVGKQPPAKTSWLQSQALIGEVKKARSVGNGVF